MLHCSAAAGEVVLICHGSLTFAVVVEHQLQTAFSSVSIDVVDQICKRQVNGGRGLRRRSVEFRRRGARRETDDDDDGDEHAEMCCVCPSTFICIASIHEERRVKRRRRKLKVDRGGQSNTRRIWWEMDADQPVVSKNLFSIDKLQWKTPILRPSDIPSGKQIVLDRCRSVFVDRLGVLQRRKENGF